MSCSTCYIMCIEENPLYTLFFKIHRFFCLNSLINSGVKSGAAMCGNFALATLCYMVTAAFCTSNVCLLLECKFAQPNTCTAVSRSDCVQCGFLNVRSISHYFFTHLHRSLNTHSLWNSGCVVFSFPRKAMLSFFTLL